MYSKQLINKDSFKDIFSDDSDSLDDGQVANDGTNMHQGHGLRQNQTIYKQLETTMGAVSNILGNRNT